MALPIFEAYALDPESEPESDVEKEPHRTERLMQDDTVAPHLYQRHHLSFKLAPLEKTDSQLIDHTYATEKHQQRGGSIEVTLEADIEEHISEHHAPAQTSEESDVSEDEEEEEEEEEKCDRSSDEDWNPQTETQWDELSRKSSSDEDSDGREEHSDSKNTLREPKRMKLCTDCGSNYFSKNHKCEHKTKLHVCNLCGKRCASETSLKLHCLIHSETYQHYCKFCYGSFKTKTDKRKHEQTKHNQRKPYKCPDCGLHFAVHRDRREHMKSHKAPDTFMCDICGLTLAKRHKPRHMLVHTGAKPYKCSICERTFNQAGNLRSHMRLHTGEKPYKCQCCNKAFNHNVSLKSHVQRYHPRESGNALEIIYDGSADDTRQNSISNDQQDAEQMQNSKSTKRKRTGLPLGRPKTYCSRSKSSEQQSFDCIEDLITFHQEQMENGAKRKSMKQKRKRNFDPNEEMHTISSRKRGRSRKV